MLYGTDCKYSTCFVCVDGEICGLQWSEEASLKKLDLSCIFKDGLDLNGLLFWEEAALSGKKKVRTKKNYQAYEAPWALKSSFCM